MFTQKQQRILYCRNLLSARVEQYVHVLQDSMMAFRSQETKARVRHLLSCLVNQALHHRDIIEGT